MSHTIHILLALTILLVALPSAYAFGAGDIPDFAYLNDKAFRHGDIENILETLVKYAGHASAGGGLLGFASQVLKTASGGSKFSKSDIKKVYFGNWLRDYSQCMDIAGLSKLSADTLVLVVSVLGFMTFGFATEEFEVTADRLGVYLCVEHIDNPKGYAEKEGDARQFHPKLRPPVDPRELEIDERTGMKKYMATENEGWDTSTAHIRRVFRACIEHGRRSGGQEGADLFEAYRLLGTGLHTMEDLLAHSNWCEIALRKLGHEEVFCHVGDNVLVDAPSGDRVPPLVTGTFGSADFLHSLLGEATDHISQASVTALSDNLNQSQNNDTAEKLSALKSILGKIGGGDDKMSQGEELQAQSQAYNFNPDDIAPPEVQKQLFDLLKWRDGLYRDIIKKIEMIPGLSDLMDEMSNALNAYVYTVIAPWLTPILTQATSALGEGSKAVIDSDDQYQVFEDENASDPSHSLLSKDHFGLVLNEPAGKIAQIVVVHTVQLIVSAWTDDSDPDQVINQALEAFHHPYYASGRSEIQRQMFDEMEKWIGGLGEEASDIVSKLTKQSVRDGKNKREGEAGQEAGYGGCGHGGGSASYARKQSSNNQQSSQQHSSSYGGGGGRTEDSSYGGRNESSYGRQDDSSYGARNESSYGAAESYGRNESSYGGRTTDDSSYGRNESSYGGRTDESSYGRHEPSGRNESSYGGRNDDSYGRNESSYGEGRDQSSYGGGRNESHGGRNDAPSYGGGRNDSSYGGREPSYGGGETYGGRTEETHGGRRHESNYGESENSSYGRGGGDEYGRGGGDEYGRPPPREEYGGGRHGHHGGDDVGSGRAGYNPSYGDNQETFGAERMKIRDNNEYEGGGGGNEGGEGYGRRREYDSGY
ncbi:heterokaryon incompatibility protein Het-C-domain-containing protein [Mucidula mucida]|nr:heterokaryon incompatibility protein Het-C-domain-containing protein [Mucidula mucida]